LGLAGRRRKEEGAQGVERKGAGLWIEVAAIELIMVNWEFAEKWIEAADLDFGAG
jgi:hypothetical protein